MTLLRDRKVRPSFPRDGETDTFPGDAQFTPDPDNDAKFLIKSTRRTLSLWENQLDALSALIGDRKGASKVTWKQEPNGKRIYPSFPDEA